jgi:hypothetical protein
MMLNYLRQNLGVSNFKNIKVKAVCIFYEGKE